LSNLRVYIRPLDETGAYTTEYVEVTKDVNANAISKISQKLDSSEYDVGVFSFSNINLKMRNSHGLYSEVGTSRTIFKSKRNDSLVKIIWLPQPNQTILGNAIVGESILGTTVEIFKGFLSDENLKSDINTQDVSFTVLGLESIFDRVETPYSSLSATGTETLLYNIMNVSEVTSLLDVSAINITVPDEQTVDDISELENTTIKEALAIILEASNSVLYVKDDTVYVTTREETAADPVTFYGQASNIGIENVVKISNIRSGRNKMFNLWRWSDSNLVSRSTSSIDSYGVKDKEVDFSLFTNTTKRQAILDEFRDEFSEPKQEMDVTVPMTYDHLDLFLLDRVNIDYPTIYMPSTEGGMPIYGVSKYGEAVYPLSQWSLSLELTDIFKIIAIDLMVKDNLIKFHLKKV